MRLVDRLADKIERGLAVARPERRLPIPAVTFAFTSAHWLVTHFSPQITVVMAIPLLGFLVAAFWWGNLISALLGALVISAYTVIETDLDFWQSSQIIFTSVVGAFLAIAAREALVHEIKEAERNRHAAALVNAANGNLEKLKQIHMDAENLLRGWRVLSDEAKLRNVEAIRGNLATVRTVWEGWHQLYREKEELMREAAGGQ